MNKSIKIDREKLETIVKKKFKTSRLTTISRALGFKDNALREALRRGRVSLKMVGALERLNIARNEYEISEEVNYTSEAQGTLTAQTGADNAIRADIIETDKLPAQMSIDDLERWRRDELKNLIKETILETLDAFSCNEIRGAYDPTTHVYTVDFIIRR